MSSDERFRSDPPGRCSMVGLLSQDCVRHSGLHPGLFSGLPTGGNAAVGRWVHSSFREGDFQLPLREAMPRLNGGSEKCNRLCQQNMFMRLPWPEHRNLYSGTRVERSRNHSIQVDATTRERRPSIKLNRKQLLRFRFIIRVSVPYSLYGVSSVVSLKFFVNAQKVQTQILRSPPPN